MPGWIDNELIKDPSDYSERHDAGFEGASEHWSLPWSDLMMTLFVLFAVLLSAQHYGPKIVERFHHEAQGAEPASKRSPILFPSGEVVLSPKTIYAMSHEAIKNAKLEHIDVVLEKDDAVRISLQGPLFFDLGSAEPGSDMIRFLNRVSTVLKKTNNAVQVLGHTDDLPVRSGQFPSNWELSAARAAAVARTLITAGDLAPERFSIVGHAMYRPLMPNMTARDRQRNRRVDIVISKKPFVGTESEVKR